MSAGDIMAAGALSFPVGELAWSPDGQWIAAGHSSGGPFLTATWTGNLAVVDAETGGMRWRVDEWRVDRVTFSPDGHRLAVAATASAERHRIRMLAAESGHELWQLSAQLPSFPVFSPDCRFLAFGGRLVEVGTGRPRFDLGVPSTLFRSGGFSSDSRWLATAATDGQVVVVDAASGALRWPDVVQCPSDIVQVVFGRGDHEVVAFCYPRDVLVFDASTGAVRTNARLDASISGMPFLTRTAPSYELSPDRQRLVAYGGNGVLGVFSVSDGQRRFKRNVGLTSAPRAGFHPYGNVIVVNASERMMRGVSARGVMLVDAESGVVVWKDPAIEVLDVAFSPDGRRFAAGGKGGGAGFMRVYDARLERSRLEHPAAVDRVAVTSAGLQLVASACADQKVRVFPVDGTPRERSHPGKINSLSFSANGQYVATGGSDSRARLYRTVPLELVWDPPILHGGPVNAVVFVPPDGTFLVTGSRDKTARMLRRDSGAEEWRLEHPQAVTQVAVSPNGRWVATGTGGAGAEPSTRLFDAATGGHNELFRYGHKAGVRSVAFGQAGDGGWLLVAGADETALLVDAATGRQITRFVHPSTVAAVAVSPDGSLLATGTAGFDRKVRLYDLQVSIPQRLGTAPPSHRPPWPPLLREVEFAAPVKRLVFNPVNGRLAVLTEDAVVRLLDPEDGFELAHLTHPAEVNDMAISADGELLVTACYDRFTRVFPRS